MESKIVRTKELIESCEIVIKKEIIEDEKFDSNENEENFGKSSASIKTFEVRAETMKIKDAECSSTTLLNDTHSNIFSMNSPIVKTEELTQCYEINIKKEIIEDENLDVNAESIEKNGASSMIIEVGTEAMKTKHSEIKRNDINIKEEIIKNETFEVKDEGENSRPVNIKTKNIKTNDDSSGQESNINIQISCIKSEKIISYSNQRGSYQCRFCEYQTENRKSMINHVELHSNECKPPSNAYVLSQSLVKHSSDSKCTLKSNKSCTSLLVSNESSCSWKQRPQFYEPKTYSKKKVLTCQKCNYSTVNISFFERHLNNHTVTETKCNSYDTEYLKPPHYESNRNINSSKETLFFCKDCDFVSANENRLIHHEKTHLLIRNIKYFKRHVEKKEFLCKHCDFKCYRKVALINHERRIHTGEMPYACLQCDYRTTIKRSLVLHMKIHSDREPLMCKLCDYKCLRPPSLVNHVRKVHTGERPYVCAHCNLGFTLKSFLVRHLRAHTREKPYSCKKCNINFKTKNSLIIHKLNHSNKKSYTCHYCNYKCTAKKSLIPHLRVHTEERSFLCEKCGGNFSSKYLLASHIKTHSSEKPYTCKYCEYKFSAKAMLILHERLHTGEKPYTCNQCNYKASGKGLLNKHLKGVHATEKLHACVICEYRTNFKDRLVYYIRTHTGEKSISCKE